MERKNNNNRLVWSVIVLVVLNIVSLSALWYSEFYHQPLPPPARQGGTPLEDVITKGVGLDAKQERNFRQLHFRHRHVKDSLEAEIFRLRQQIQIELFSADPDTNKVLNLSNQIGSLNAEFEKQSFLHFRELRAICRPDQYSKLEAFLNDLLNASRHRSPPKQGIPEPLPPRPKDTREPPPPEHQ